jgi:hypothetical protein
VYNPQTNVYGYRSGHLRALAAMLLLTACAGVHLLFALLHGLQIVGLTGTADDLGTQGDSVAPFVLIRALLLLLNFFVLVFTIVAFLMWLHRAYSNLRPLGAQQLNDTPGWAVGSFFIPFVNLVRPYKAVREVWRWSKPVSDASNEIAGLSFTADTSAPLVGLWWGLWIASNVLSNLFYRASKEKDAPEIFAGLGLAADVMTILAAAAAIFMIYKIDRMQEDKSMQLALSSSTFEPPPPPPTFDTQTFTLH